MEELYTKLFVSSEISHGTQSLASLTPGAAKSRRGGPWCQETYEARHTYPGDF